MAEGVPDEDTIELWLLGDVYRLLTQGRDRRSEGSPIVHHATGLPLTRDDLVPDSYALRGEPLALQWLVQPRQWARIHMGLAAHPEHTWSQDAIDAVEETRQRLVRVIQRLVSRGLMDDHPDMGHGYGELGEDKDGSPLAARFTHAGIGHARERIAGTSLASGPVSIVHELTPEQRRDLPAWVEAEYRQEVRA